MGIIKLLRIIVVTLFYSIRATNRIKKGQDNYFFKYCKIWAEKVVKIAGIELEIIGKEKIINNQYIFAANHRSLFDVPILIAALPYDLSYIYKKELDKIPIFGKTLNLSPYIGVERETRQGAIDAIKKSKDRIEKGYSIMIFPEGTRTETNELLEFKKGSFAIAKSTKVPILPISLSGTENLLKKGSYKINGGKVRIYMSDEELVENLDDETIKKIRNKIENNL